MLGPFGFCRRICTGVPPLGPAMGGPTDRQVNCGPLLNWCLCKGSIRSATRDGPAMGQADASPDRRPARHNLPITRKLWRRGKSAGNLAGSAIPAGGLASHNRETWQGLPDNAVLLRGQLLGVVRVEVAHRGEMRTGPAAFPHRPRARVARKARGHMQSRRVPPGTVLALGCEHGSGRGLGRLPAAHTRVRWTR